MIIAFRYAVEQTTVCIICYPAHTLISPCEAVTISGQFCFRLPSVNSRYSARGHTLGSVSHTYKYHNQTQHTSIQLTTMKLSIPHFLVYLVSLHRPSVILTSCFDYYHVSRILCPYLEENY